MYGTIAVVLVLVMASSGYCQDNATITDAEIIRGAFEGFSYLIIGVLGISSFICGLRFGGVS
jgi:hypothetical protein